MSSPSGVRGSGRKRISGIFLGHRTLLADRNVRFFCSVMRKINIFVNDCVKYGEAIIYQGLWGTGPFIRGGTAHL